MRARGSVPYVTQPQGEATRAVQSAGWVEPLRNPSFFSRETDGFRYALPILRAGADADVTLMFHRDYSGNIGRKLDLDVL
jgi:hypothetical protein